MDASRRLHHLTSDPEGGWALFFKARAMKAAGDDVIELTVGQHDIPTDPRIVDAMTASARNGNTGYAPIGGTDALRAAIATRITRKSGVPTDPSQILVTSGGQAALFLAHMAALEPGDRALFLDPYYATYPGTIRAAGAEPVAFPLSADEGFLPDIERLRDAARDARSLLINSPNNPTGVVYPEKLMSEIRDLAETAGVWVISDEVYDSMDWTGTGASLRKSDPDGDQSLIIGSFSKLFAMTGFRIGWVIGRPDVIDAMANLVTHTTYGAPGFIQDAAAAALSIGPELEDAVAQPFRHRRDLVLAALETQNVVRAVPPDGAMYVMLDVRATGLTGQDFAERLLATRRIAVMPGESFGQAAAGHIRIALTVPEDDLSRAMEAILDVAVSQAGRKTP